MTLDRYRKTLIDECEFWDLHMGVLGRAERLIRLAGRICKGHLHREDKAFQKITRDELLRRLRTSRSSRLRACSKTPATTLEP